MSVHLRRIVRTSVVYMSHIYLDISIYNRAGGLYILVSLCSKNINRVKLNVKKHIFMLKQHIFLYLCVFRNAPITTLKLVRHKRWLVVETDRGRLAGRGYHFKRKCQYWCQEQDRCSAVLRLFCGNSPEHIFCSQEGFCSQDRFLRLIIFPLKAQSKLSGQKK
jgi:hypothetical protein